MSCMDKLAFVMFLFIYSGFRFCLWFILMTVPRLFIVLGPHVNQHWDLFWMLVVLQRQFSHNSDNNSSPNLCSSEFKVKISLSCYSSKTVKTVTFVYVCMFVCVGRCLRDVSAKSHCPTLTPLVRRGVGTVGLTHPVKRVVFRHSESEDRTLEAMATPLRTDLMGTNRLTCPRDMVSQNCLEALFLT